MNRIKTTFLLTCLTLLLVATSIDALAVGFSMAMLGISTWLPTLVIGVVAAVLTVAGMLLGRNIRVSGQAISPGSPPSTAREGTTS